VGGTGEFAYAQGVVNRTVWSMNRGVNIVELDIRVVSLITSTESVRYSIICPSCSIIFLMLRLSF
jgi:hypothetical protein